MNRSVVTAIALLAMVACSAVASLASEQSPLSRIAQASVWLNGKVTQADLRGKVVLLDFYTFDCINCKHTEPNLRSLYHNVPHHDLAIVSVHSPETSYEKDRSNLVVSLHDQGIEWPVAVDNDFAIWNSFGIDAWPTQLIFDRHGILRAKIVGEGQDAEINRTVAQLIAER